jgi:hypothetical protein
VSDAYIISYNRFCPQVGAVDNGPILHIYLVSEADAVNITPHHGIEPYTAIVTHHHIAGNGGIWGNETVVSKLWHNIFYREDIAHVYIFL